MEDGSPANDDQTQIPNPNELTTEMSEAEEQAFVDATLGIKPKAKDKDDGDDADDKGDGGAGSDESDSGDSEDEKDTTDDKDKKDETEEDSKETEIKDEDKPTVTKPEDEKPVEIPAVDISDLWIEVEALQDDGEGNLTPQTIKLTVDGELPDNIKFKNDKQLYEVIDAVNEMRAEKANREKVHAEAVEEQEAKETAKANEKATLDAWDVEIAQLIEAGVLEEPKVKVGEAGFEEDPGLVVIDKVFKFMTEQNDIRIKEQKSPIRSFTTAFTMWQKEQSSSEEAKKAKEDEEKTKKEAELTKKRGALVGGGSGGGGIATSSIYKRGSASSIYQVDTSDL